MGHLEKEVARRKSQSRLTSGGLSFCWVSFFFFSFGGGQECLFY